MIYGVFRLALKNIEGIDCAFHIVGFTVIIRGEILGFVGEIAQLIWGCDELKQQDAKLVLVYFVSCLTKFMSSSIK